MDRQDGLGSLPDGPFEQRGIHVVGVRLDVHEHRLRAQARDGAGRRKERVRHRDHLVSRSHAAGHERQQDRVGAGGHADGLAHADVFLNVLLQIGHARPEDERLLVADRFEGRHDLRADLTVLGFQVE